MHALAASVLWMVVAFIVMVPAVSLAVWGGMCWRWPKFRTRGMLLRVTEGSALVLAGMMFLRARGPATAQATAPPAAPPPPPPASVLPTSKTATTAPVHSKPLPATIMDVEGRSFLVAELPATRP